MLTLPIKLRNWQIWLLPLVHLFYGIIETFFGNTLHVNHGLGWDGKVYADIIRHFDYVIEFQVLDGFYFSRVLPLAVVHHILSFVTDLPTNEEIITAFKLLNLASLGLCHLLVIGIGRKLVLSDFQVLLLQVLIFANFHFLVQVFFNPVLLDMFNMVYILTAIFGWLNGYRIALFSLLFISTFIAPHLPLTTLLLIAFPYKLIRQTNVSPEPVLFWKKLLLSWLLASIVIGFFGFVSTKIIQINYNYALKNSNIYMNYINIFIYIFFIVWLLIPAWKGVFSTIRLQNQTLKDYISAKTIAGVGLIFLASSTIKAIYAQGPGHNGLQNYILLTFNALGHLPFKPLAAHTAYFGSSALLFFMPFFCFRLFSFGQLFILSVILLHSIDLESRHLLHYLPLICIFSIKQFQLKPAWSVLFTLVTINLIVSGVFFRIQLDKTKLPIPFGSWQSYFKYHGPWMNVENYAYFLCCFLVLLLLGWFLFFRHYSKRKTLLID